MRYKCLKYGDDISTDLIIAGKYTKTLNLADLALLPEKKIPREAEGQAVPDVPQEMRITRMIEKRTGTPVEEIPEEALAAEIPEAEAQVVQRHQEGGAVWMKNIWRLRMTKWISINMRWLWNVGGFISVRIRKMDGKK